jgi:hypothetical protein
MPKVTAEHFGYSTGSATFDKTGAALRQSNVVPFHSYGDIASKS